MELWKSRGLALCTLNPQSLAKCLEPYGYATIGANIYLQVFIYIRNHSKCFKQTDMFNFPISHMK